ncbi:MAG: holo-ACP synthase [Patescibacteria group bacterium]|mgnify:CR=1 FL=1
MTKKHLNVVSGVDIEEISRFKKLSLIKDKNFLSKIYTKAELDYCFGRSNAGAHLAGRFVAKEAVYKALSALGRAVDLKKIEISSNIAGVPMVKLRDLRLAGLSVSLSISHCRNWAVAFALVVYDKPHKKNQ